MESYAIFGVSPWREFVNNIQYAALPATVNQHSYLLPILSPWFEKAVGGEVTVDGALAGIEEALAAAD